MSAFFSVFKFSGRRERGVVAALICAFVLLVAGKSPPEMSVESAVKILSTTKPIPDAAFLITATINAKVKTGKLELFNEQLTALRVIRNSHQQVDVGVLLPFLDMTMNKNVAFFGYKMCTNDLRVLRVRFPALGAIVDMPGAAQALEKFSLDKSKSTDSRVDSLQVLSLIDQVRFMNAAGQLRDEILAKSLDRFSGNIIRDIDRLEGGNIAFAGKFHANPIWFETAAEN